jgi:glutamyl-tRNA reductase
MNMTHYIVVGTSHQQSTVAHREQLTFSPEEIQRVLPAIVSSGVVLESVLLSTCNRTEIYLAAEDPAAALLHVAACLRQAKGEAASFLFGRGYQKQNRECVQHLLRVAAGLESQMMGEPQILNQVKAAHQLASEARATGLYLNRLFNSALQSGKRVRHETAIGVGAVSIASAAVDLLRRKLPANENAKMSEHSRATVVLLGAGEMARGAAMQLMAKKRNTIRLRIASRSRDRSGALAQEVGGESIAWENFPQALGEATAVIAAVSAPQPVLRVEHFTRRNGAAKAFRPLLCIDIGMPRNIDPQVAQLPNVRLFDLDHLNGMIDKNLQIRLSELPKAEKIIDEVAAEFAEWYHSLKVVPIIKNLFRYGDEIRQQEIERNRKNFRPEEWDHLNALTASLVSKLLHLPISRLKEWANDPHNRDNGLEAVCDFFAMGENLVSKNSENRHTAE